MPTNSVLNGAARMARTDLREKRYRFLYPERANLRRAQPTERIAEIFSRYSSTQQTAFDQGGGLPVASPGALSMERQVQRALVQVLGRAPGRGAGSFLSALNDTFPVLRYGQVTRTPSRSIGPTVDADGQADSFGLSSTSGAFNQMSTRQATIHRQVRLIAGDALRILPMIDGFNPQVDTEEIAALKALIDSQLRCLVDEFGRIDGPRPRRVETLFAALRGVPGAAPEVFGSVKLLGQRALLDCETTRVTTVQDEVQTTNYELLASYVERLYAIWEEFSHEPGSPCGGYSARLEHVTGLLPVINEANKAFIAALDAVGFGAHNQVSGASSLSLLRLDLEWFGNEPELFAEPPKLTIRELDEWVDRFTASEAPALLTDAGQYGMDVVSYHADELFTIVYTILVSAGDQRQAGTLLVRALQHERVRWALEDVFFQLKDLADTADAK